MSKHRADDRRSVSRLMPLGAGMTVAFLAAGTGSAFAVTPGEVITPSAPLTCEAATTAVGVQQGLVDTATAKRDAARTALQNARTEFRNAQAPYHAALRDRDDARERLDSLLNRRDRKEAAATSAQKRLDELKKKQASARALRSAQSDLAHANAAVRAVDGEIVKARENLTTAETALTKATPVDIETKRAAVTTAKANLAQAETDLEKARGERRTARADRAQACTTSGPTSGVTTIA